MKYPLKYLLAGILAGFLILVFSGVLQAREVQVIAQGPNRDAAIKNAQRKAIEQVLGTYVKSESKVSEGDLDYDRIISSASGYIKDYSVVSEGKDPVQEVFKVKIRADISSHKVKSVLQEFLKDPRFQKTFQKTEFNNRRVVVLYNRRSEHDLKYNSKGVQTVMDLVQDKLAEYGFRIFLPEQLERIKEKATDMAVDEETAIKLARQEDGDASVVVTIDAGKRRTDDGYNVIYSTLSLNAFDPTTGELFANVQERGKTMSRQGDYAISDGVSRLAIKIGKQASQDLTQKIVERFSTSRQKFTTMIFRDFNTDTLMQIESVVADNLGWKYRIAKQADQYLELETFVDMKPTSVRRTFYQAADKQGICLKPEEIKGSRILFSGAGCQ